MISPGIQTDTSGNLQAFWQHEFYIFLCKSVKINIDGTGGWLGGDVASLGGPWSIKVSQCTA